MALRVYDTLRRRVVDLELRDPPRVAMYACGPTVYGYIHVGNARTFVWYDLIRRYLEARGFDVTYVMNYTDVDDKIIERSKVEGIPPESVARKYAQAFEEDMSALGVQPPTILVRATEHIDDMIKAIQGLVERGIAYEVDGDVFFSVEAFPSYGKLSGRSLDDMREERVEPHPGKRHPVDFALWKAAKEDEPAWPSPWGPGRPGWHIECSVMSTRYLGMGFDVHGGATDLVFPHHENEMAQAEAVSGGEPFVRHWVHAGLVQMEAEKMSKSLGNFVLVRDALEQYPGEVLRYWALSASYRTPAVFSDASLDDAAEAYDRWRTFVQSARHALGDDAWDRIQRETSDSSSPPLVEINNGHAARFAEAMDDDFNTPAALAALHELVRDGNRCIDAAQRGDRVAGAALEDFAGACLLLTSVLGFSFREDKPAPALVAGLIEYMIELREQARAERAFDRADAIRSRLHDLGIAVEDTPAGPRWRLIGTRGEASDGAR